VDHLIVTLLNLPVDLYVADVQVGQVLEDIVILPAGNELKFKLRVLPPFQPHPSRWLHARPWPENKQKKLTCSRMSLIPSWNYKS